MLPGFGVCVQQLGMSYLLQQLKGLPSAALRAFWPALHSRSVQNVDKISVKTIICTHLSLKHLSELSFLELSRVELSSQVHMRMLGSVLHAF